MLSALIILTSKDDCPAVPIDARLGPLGADDGVDRDRVILTHAPVCSPLPTGYVLTWLHCQDNVVFLPSQFIVVHQVEGPRVRCDLSACQGDIC